MVIQNYACLFGTSFPLPKLLILREALISHQNTSGAAEFSCLTLGRIGLCVWRPKAWSSIEPVHLNFLIYFSSRRIGDYLSRTRFGRYQQSDFDSFSKHDRYGLPGATSRSPIRAFHRGSSAWRIPMYARISDRSYVAGCFASCAS